MAEISLVLFLTVELEGELSFAVETQESEGLILDVPASGRLLEAVCEAVGQLSPGAGADVTDEATTNGSL